MIETFRVPGTPFKGRARKNSEFLHHLVLPKLFSYFVKLLITLFPIQHSPFASCFPRPEKDAEINIQCPSNFPPNEQQKRRRKKVIKIDFKSPFFSLQSSPRDEHFLRLRHGTQQTSLIQNLSIFHHILP